MPFQPAGGSFSITGIESCSAHHPCHGHTASGDGLFEEVGRTDGRHLLLLADVMGHGPGAAETLDTFSTFLLTNPECCDAERPGQLLTILNGLLQYEYAATQRFVAAQAILVDVAAGALAGGNAGLPQPRTRRDGRGWVEWSMPGEMMLGVPAEGVAYPDGDAEFPAPSCLLAFTDGVTEAVDAAEVQFEHGPLGDWLAGLAAEVGAGELVNALLTAVQAHVQANWPQDDTTVYCLSRPAAGQKVKKARKSRARRRV